MVTIIRNDLVGLMYIDIMRASLGTIILGIATVHHEIFAFCKLGCMYTLKYCNNYRLLHSMLHML